MITIDLERRHQRWEAPGFSGGSAETTVINFEGTQYEVHDNVYISVLPTNVCNASCGFCSSEIEQPMDEISLKTSSSATVIDFAQSVDRMMKCLSALPIVPPVSISGGGEPTLSPKLPRTLEVLREHCPSKLIIHTNGTRLQREAPGQQFMKNAPKEKWTVLEHLLHAGLNHLNWSIAHHNPKISAKIMRLKKELPTSEIEAAIKKAIQEKCRPRLSLVLLKDGIQNLNGLKKYLDWARNLGVDDVIVRELGCFDPTTTTMNETARYIQVNRISFDSIFEGLDSDADFILTQQKSGQTHYRESYRYRNSVDVGFLVYRFVPPNEEARKKTAKMLVVHPNGSVNASWDVGAKIVIPPKQKLYELGW